MSTGITILAAACLLIPAAYGVLVVTWLIRWQGLRNYMADAGAPMPAVSIVVAARNEESNIGPCLRSLLAQEYPAVDWEIVVVNDFSTDGTMEAINRIIAVAPPGRVRVVDLAGSLDGASGSKKAALHAGIGEARYPLIATTDADCTMGAAWLHTMISYLSATGSSLVSGPVRIHGNRFFSKWQALEFMGLIGTGAAVMDSDYPLMCNGANLAFKKEVYHAMRAAEPYEMEPSSGDDTFLMLAIRKHRAGRMVFARAAEAMVTTRPCTTAGQFVRQRIRWAAKTKNYGLFYVAVIGFLVAATHLVILAGAVAVVMKWMPAAIMVAGIGIKLVADSLFTIYLSRFFGDQKYLMWLPVAFLLHMAYVPVVAVLSLFCKVRWKGRRV